ncbi:uncharacterized protein LOC119073857 isoform X2 [Bradysia coprophila]|uniref:uncharacterized protein LOC119073857 isoform X2 n=1 Tax=Bradysia coprophila TaxID=38358 RepID=UPI00187DBCCA|nr:uncharacterized protein LOC119073857 isoform X2 [Bradysia coprophila]
MAMQIDKKTSEKFDEIWAYIESELKTPVPTYFKYILSYCGFNNAVSIASIDDDDISHFVKEVRKGNVSKYFRPLIGDRDVLEGSTQTVENFEFTRGHLKYLKHIVMFLKENCKTTSKSKPKTNSKQSEWKAELSLSEMEKDIEKHRQILCKKLVTTLKSLTKKLYNINRTDIEKKIQNNQLVSVEIKQSEQLHSENSTQGFTKELSFKFTASSFCPYCSKKVNVFWISNMKWNSSNFDRHLSLVHPKTYSDSEEDAREVTTYEIPVAAVNTATNTTGVTPPDVLSGATANEMDKPLSLINESDEPLDTAEKNAKRTDAIEMYGQLISMMQMDNMRSDVTEKKLIATSTAKAIGKGNDAVDANVQINAPFEMKSGGGNVERISSCPINIVGYSDSEDSFDDASKEMCDQCESLSIISSVIKPEMLTCRVEGSGKAFFVMKSDQ